LWVGSFISERRLERNRAVSIPWRLLADRRCRTWLGYANKVVEGKSRVVGAQADRTVKVGNNGPKIATPSFNSIRADNKSGAAHFGVQNMGLPDGDFWRLGRSRLFEIDVASGVALLVRAHSGIALDRNGNARIRFDMPHCIDEIAGILRAQFDADLPAQFAGRQRL